MNISSDYSVANYTTYTAKKTPQVGGEPFVIPEDTNKENEHEKGFLSEYVKDEEKEEEEKKEVLIDYFMKALDERNAEADTSQSKEEKGAENLAIKYEMSNKIYGDFGGRLMSGDALNAPHETYWIR